MKCQSFPFFAAVFALTFAWGLTSLHAADEAALDTATIEAITGLKGVSNQKEGTFKVSKPRDDVSVTVEQSHLAPFMGLTSWAAFMPSGKDNAMVMGDIVLFQDEVNPVMSAALNAGLQVTALHNHFFFDMEKEIRAKTPVPADSFGLEPLPAQSFIDGNAISRVFGQTGDAKDGMYKVTIGRVVQMAGMDMGNTMGVNTWAAFAGTPDDALVVGDFAVLENELQTVLKTLREANINIVAIHHHMTGENPRMIFLHYYGRGKALDLAQGVKAAINTQPLAANK
jgi:hypothetical protein